MSTEPGNPTELCLRLRKRTDKPHIWLLTRVAGYVFVASSANTAAYSSWRFCRKVNPLRYKTPGEAARAWHDHKAD